MGTVVFFFKNLTFLRDKFKPIQSREKSITRALLPHHQTLKRSLILSIPPNTFKFQSFEVLTVAEQANLK